MKVLVAMSMLLGAAWAARINFDVTERPGRCVNDATFDVVTKRDFLVNPGFIEATLNDAVGPFP